MPWKKIQWSDDAAAVTVRKNSGANIGTRPRLNFIEGSNITLAISDDAGSDEIDISITAAGYSHPSARQCTTGNWAWASITGKPSTYPPSAHENSHESGGSDVLEFDSLADGSTYKKFLNTERTKLSGIETGADVTDATNVNAAGAVMLSDASIAFDTLTEKTGNAGVNVETVNLKDGHINELKKLIFKDSTELTIASGVITVTQTRHNVDTEGNAGTDNLVTINGGEAGQMLILTTTDSARDVTLKHGTGNILISGGDYTLDSAYKMIILVYSGGYWMKVM